MQWNIWNEQEGELSLREQIIATLAFKLNANISLTDAESVAQQQQLQDEDVFAVIKMAAIFTFWQQLCREHEHTNERTSEHTVATSSNRPAVVRPPFDPAPYFYEGAPSRPQTTSNGVHQASQLEFTHKNGAVSHNGFDHNGFDRGAIDHGAIDQSYRNGAGTHG